MSVHTGTYQDKIFIYQYILVHTTICIFFIHWYHSNRNFCTFSDVQTSTSWYIRVHTSMSSQQACTYWYIWVHTLFIWMVSCCSRALQARLKAAHANGHTSSNCIKYKPVYSGLQVWLLPFGTLATGRGRRRILGRVHCRRRRCRAAAACSARSCCSSA